MNKEAFLADRYVKQFSNWLELKLDGSGAFPHSYYLKVARRDWSCNCLYEAYKSYWWRFTAFCPVARRWISGTSSRESFEYLSRLAKAFRASVHDNDNDLACECAFSMLKWGGVEKSNRERIIGMGEDVCDFFRYAQSRLNLSTVRLKQDHGVHINSGFTKLFFLLIDDFIMYDGRVGAALGLMVRNFCEENDLFQIPATLNFAYGSGRGSSGAGNRRDPSLGRYKFAQFSSNHRRHLRDNIKASWLLKAVADNTGSRFSQLSQDSPLNERLTALQSALFMIGYDVRRREG